MAISAAPLDSRSPWESRRAKRTSELWEITGATGAVDDTVAITTRMRAPVACVSGAFTYTVSGRVITLTAKVALADLKACVEIVGDI